MLEEMLISSSRQGRTEGRRQNFPNLTLSQESTSASDWRPRDTRTRTPLWLPLRRSWRPSSWIYPLLSVLLCLKGLSAEHWTNHSNWFNLLFIFTLFCETLYIDLTSLVISFKSIIPFSSTSYILKSHTNNIFVFLS